MTKLHYLQDHYLKELDIRLREMVCRTSPWRL